MTASIPIWKLGDFFCLEDLCKLALRERDEYFRKRASFFSATETDQLLAPKTVTILVHLVQTVYKEEWSDVQKVFRPPVVAFLLSCVHCLLPDMKEFEDLLREVPEFALDWAMAVTNTLGSKKMPKRTSNKCKKCGELGATSFDLAKWLTKQCPDFYCEDCFPLPRLENWKGEGSKKT